MDDKAANAWAQHAREVLKQAVEAFIAEFLRKATKADVFVLRQARLQESGMLQFRDETGMPVRIEVTFGKHFSAEELKTNPDWGFEENIARVKVVNTEAVPENVAVLLNPKPESAKGVEVHTIENFGPADGPLTNEEIEAAGVRLPAWDQSDGVQCAICGGDATFCSCVHGGAARTLADWKGKSRWRRDQVSTTTSSRSPASSITRPMPSASSSAR